MIERRWMLFVEVPERITCADCGYEPVNQNYDRDGDEDGKPRFEGADPNDYIVWDSASGGRWRIFNSGIERYRSTEDVALPSDVVTWSLIFGSGATNPVPTVTHADAINTTTQVYPSNTAAIKYTWERNMDEGQIFFRKKLATDLSFGGSIGKVDFDRFWNLRLAGGCDPLYIEQQKLRRGQWRTAWRGRFTASAMAFDLGRCIASVRPTVFDRYTCIFDEYERLHNVLEVSPRTAEAAIWPSNLQLLVRTSTSFAPFTAADFGYALVATQSVTLPVYGACGGGATTLYLYWRERVVVDCVENSGSAPSPQGDGWVQPPLTGEDDLTCLSSGTQVWARLPTVPWPLGASPMTAGPAAAAGDPVLEPSSPACPQWVRAGTLTCVGGDSVGIFICPSLATVFETYETVRPVEEVMNFLALKTSCRISVASDFFEWNPPTDAPGYEPGINYVTGQANQLGFLGLIQKSDAIDPDASDPAQKGETSLLAMLRLLNTMFRVFWDLDEDGVLRIEHISYWTTVYDLDLTTSARNSEPLAFASTKDEAPAYERCLFTEALNVDFKGVDIIYAPECAGSSGKEYRAEVTTDLAYIKSDPNSIDKSGFVMVAMDDSLNVFCTLGAYSGALGTNTPLSWANLHAAFWLHDRFLPSGNMNGAPMNFLGFLETIEQSGVLVVCPDELAFNPRDGAQGLLSEALGLSGGVISRAEWSDQEGALRLSIRYQFP
jgi:hypothetical protein